MKKVIIFDLDGTLTASKSSLDQEMASLLCELLRLTKVAVISGASFKQFQKQFLNNLSCQTDVIKNLYLFPQTGTAFYRWEGKWRQVYADKFTEAEVQEISGALERALEETNFPQPKKLYGPQIENRGSQVTFSANGQNAPLAIKGNYDLDRKKRKPVQKVLQMLLPHCEIVLGGSNSIDILRKGVDKAFGVRQISEHLSIPIEEMIFVGDALYPGGNDHAALRTGIEAKAIQNHNETKSLIKNWLEGLG